MATGFWGKKIGMTQVFVNDKVVPVTAIDVASWFVTGIKTVDCDGYAAIQVGCVRPRYNEKPFDKAWLKKTKQYFMAIREIRLQGDTSSYAIGSLFSYALEAKEGEQINVTGTSKGCGFAGVVRRHGFGGPPGSHGSTMGNRPGSIGFITSQGKVIKGKKLPGRMGNKRTHVKGLTVVTVHPENNIVLIKGAIPGKTGSLVFVQKV